MKELSDDEKLEIARELMNNQPLESLGHVALLKIVDLAISTNADNAELSAEATFNGKRYKCNMLVTWEEI